MSHVTLYLSNLIAVSTFCFVYHPSPFIHIYPGTQDTPPPSYINIQAPRIPLPLHTHISRHPGYPSPFIHIYPGIQDTPPPSYTIIQAPRIPLHTHISRHPGDPFIHIYPGTQKKFYQFLTLDRLYMAFDFPH